MIFSHTIRTDDSPKRFAESEFRFLDRSAYPAVSRVRDFLEECCQQYPQSHRDDLVKRMTKGNDVEFASVTFEILVHATLSRVGFKVEPHVEVNGKLVDFEIETPTGATFFVEAVLTSEDGWTDPSAERRKGLVYDALGAGGHPNFYVTTTTVGDPTSQPSGKGLRKRLIEWLDSLDADEILERHAAAGNESLPTIQWAHEGWELSFTAVPISPNRRGQATTLLAARSHGAGWVHSSTPIRNQVRFKGRKYGNLNKPLLVALNHISFRLDSRSVDQALYGTEQMRVSPGVEPQTSRASDGAWLRRDGPHLRFCSGVWAFDNVDLYNFSRKAQLVYLHPEPFFPLPDDLRQFPLVTLEQRNGTLLRSAGRDLSEIFQLPTSWPE